MCPTLPLEGHERAQSISVRIRPDEGSLSISGLSAARRFVLPTQKVSPPYPPT